MDGWAVAAILAKASGYGAALLAMGGPLFLAFFPAASPDLRQLARKLAVLAALAGLAVLALRFGIRSARISGMGPSGAIDPVMLGLVWDSPLGTAALWYGAGAVLILALVAGGRVPVMIAIAGAGLMALSHTVIGHALGTPRLLLASLLAVHLLAAGFWIGALAPLHRAAARAESADLLHRFGVLATGAVAALVAAGLTFAYLMVGSVAGLTGTAYGWTLMGKLALVTGLLGLAARNKLRLVPALASGDAAAPGKLRRAIRLEALVVALILLATASLTSVTTPPVNL